MTSESTTAPVPWEPVPGARHTSASSLSPVPSIPPGTPYPPIAWNGVRAHAPGPDGRLIPVSFAPFDTPLQPRERPRKRRSGRADTVGGPGRRGKATIQTRLGITLIFLSLCLALGTCGGPYLAQRHQQSENEAFLSGLSRFGPTPTPLAAQATYSAQYAPGAPQSGATSGMTIPDSPTTRAMVSTAQSAPHLAPPPISPIQSSPAARPPVAQPAPTRITIPAIGVNAAIVEVGASPTVVDGQNVSIWDVPGFAVGHQIASANPGEGENVVLNGHDDTQGEVFRDLWQLQKGAKITVQAGDHTWTYHVETILAPQEIGVPLAQRLENAVYIGATGDERLTLITCWPYNINDHRLIVIARPD